MPAVDRVRFSYGPVQAREPSIAHTPMGLKYRGQVDARTASATTGAVTQGLVDEDLVAWVEGVEVVLGWSWV